jgi:uncharacterized coiled-coil protein SlyX
MNNDIADLQERITFQDDVIAKLSDQIALHDRDLMDTKQQLRMLREKLLELSEDFEQIAPSNSGERPPHY